MSGFAESNQMAAIRFQRSGQFEGLIDNLYLFNRLLTVGEIAALP